MAIEFDAKRWDRIRGAYGQWWAGILKRPLIDITVRGARQPGRPQPALPSQFVTADYGPGVSADDIVDRWDYDLSCFRFPGDAFPHIWTNFGPGVIAEFLGARAHVGNNTVWFEADAGPIDQLALKPGPDSPFLRRIEDIYRAAIRRWNGSVQMSMVDLGGNLDILASFRSAGGLAMELYDEPAHIERLTWEGHHAWMHYFERLNRLLHPVSPGYSSWCPIYCDQPWYMLQCDFAYMISPQMFAQFVRPELQATCRRIKGFYHLDGVGQLPHLDLLLEMPELMGIQWIPGNGQPSYTHWPDVYRRIRSAGKLIQVYADSMDTLDVLADQLGSAEGICLVGEVGPQQEDQLMRMLDRYGAL